MKKSEYKKFFDKLKPYPFCKDGNKDVYVKVIRIPYINKDEKLEYQRNDEFSVKSDIIQISLINENMLESDAAVFNGQERKTFYRPYFYEFYADVNSIKDEEILGFLQEYQGVWLKAQFISKDEQCPRNSYVIHGTVFFSASPFKISNRSLAITDKLVSDEFNNKYKDTYSTAVSVVSKYNKRYYDMCNIINNITHGYDFSTRIYNVGQGNCIYIHTNDGKRILFDIGYNKNPKSTDWKDPNIVRSKHSIGHFKPHVNILSHWDMDHIIGVAFTKNNMFEHPWIAPDINELSTSEKTMGAVRLAKYLCWKKQLYLIDKSFLGGLVYKSAGGSFRLWRGLGKNNNGRLKHGLNKKNNFGLIIELLGNRKMILPGDCEYAMFPQQLINSKGYDYLVVPHHCSRMQCINLQSRRRINEKNYAIISVGDNSYKPKHPYFAHIRYLKTISYDIIQTTKNWYIEVPSLNTTTFCKIK